MKKTNLKNNVKESLLIISLCDIIIGIRNLICEDFMGHVAFDTQKFVETLEDAGIPKNQARAISVAVQKSHDSIDMATKSDINELRNEIKFDISELNHKVEDVRKDVENRFDKLGLQLTVRFGSMLIVAVGVLTAILKIVN